MTKLKTFRSEVNSSTFPISAPDVTTWNYDLATGLLLQKVYTDNHGPTYTYDSMGRLATRTWARPQSGTGVSPVVPLVTTYTYSQATGELLNVVYSDGTTPSIGYVYDRIGRQSAVTDAAGTRTFAYSATDLSMISETITGNLYNRMLSYTYDNFRRIIGFGTDNGCAVTHQYNAHGQYNGLAVGNQNVHFNYRNDSELLDSITRANGVTTLFTYEPHRNLVTNLTHSNSGAIISSFAHVYDILGRRSNRQQSGSSFASSFSSTITYGYNTRSEVTGAVADIDSAYNYQYAFDPVGNRLTSVESTMANTYTANSLNQYTAIASSVNSAPPAVESPAYDLDGNQLTLVNQVGAWTLTWDGENRLVGIAKSGISLAFKYDYKSRRIEKTVTENGAIIKHQKFVYNGCRLIQNVDALNNDTPVQEFTWGVDNELRFITDRSTNTIYNVHHDANRNITELTDGTGTVVAHYEYDPFGQATVKSGAMADANPFRFGSEFFDTETWLYAYLLRYYNPGNGNWENRDPIEEYGGVNLYGYVHNNAILRWDFLGLWGEGQKVGGPGVPFGHSDFPGQNDPFDYNVEDGGWTWPLWPWAMWRHFRDIKNSENDLGKAVSACSVDGFQRYAHQMQDYFSHYGQGFRAWRLGHGWATIWNGLKKHGGFDYTMPDDGSDAYRYAFNQASERTGKWFKLWGKCCKKCQKGNGAPSWQPIASRDEGECSGKNMPPYTPEGPNGALPPTPSDGWWRDVGGWIGDTGGDIGRIIGPGLPKFKDGRLIWLL